MDISWYREKIKHVKPYEGVHWSIKVDKMSNTQVMAIYHSFKEKGKFDKQKGKKKEKDIYYQYTIFDYMGGI